tara:strand:+ start:114 stop:335 length:222 start_codon:yes stop_codon:yes gene_type:complete
MQKRILLVAISVLTLFSISAFSPALNNESVNVDINSEFVECKYGQCYATAKSTEKRCKHCVSKEGDTYCWQHD